MFWYIARLPSYVRIRNSKNQRNTKSGRLQLRSHIARAKHQTQCTTVITAIPKNSQCHRLNWSQIVMLTRFVYKDLLSCHIKQIMNAFHSCQWNKYFIRWKIKSPIQLGSASLNGALELSPHEIFVPLHSLTLMCVSISFIKHCTSFLK